MEHAAEDERRGGGGHEDDGWGGAVFGCVCVCARAPSPHPPRSRHRLPSCPPPPLIFCFSQPRFMWLGGGHVDLKLGVAVDEFVSVTGCKVQDVTYSS